MTKHYEIWRHSVQIKAQEDYKIEEGCTIWDTDPELLKQCDSLQDAERALRKYRSTVERVPHTIPYYQVVEYILKHVTRTDDGDVDEDEILEIAPWSQPNRNTLREMHGLRWAMSKQDWIELINEVRNEIEWKILRAHEIAYGRPCGYEAKVYLYADGDLHILEAPGGNSWINGNCICIHIARAWRCDDYEYNLEDYDSEDDCIQDVLDNEIAPYTDDYIDVYIKYDMRCWDY